MFWKTTKSLVGSFVRISLSQKKRSKSIFFFFPSHQDNQQFQQQLHQIQHYTGQLAKDTSKHLRDLNAASSGAGGAGGGGEQRQWRLQRERLHNDFTKALNSFQVRHTDAHAYWRNLEKL